MAAGIFVAVRDDDEQYLFRPEFLVIPRLDENIVDLILRKASEDFDWSAISPTIFGAVFESTLNPETRRSARMPRAIFCHRAMFPVLLLLQG